MNKLHTFLKVKHTSLADEATRIRKEENKLRKMTKWAKDKQDDTLSETCLQGRLELYHHRKSVVGLEARAAHIALAFLKGKPYWVVESKVRPDKYLLQKMNNTQKVYPYHYYDNTTWFRVVELVQKYESVRAYHNKSTRRLFAEVQQEVHAWRDQHPQFFGEKTEEWLKKTAVVPRVKKPYNPKTENAA